MPNKPTISIPPNTASGNIFSSAGADNTKNDLSPEQLKNKAIIEDEIRSTLGNIPSFHGALPEDFQELGKEMGIKEGDEVSLDNLDLTDQEILDAIIESSIVDLLREVNNSAWVLSQSSEQLKESSKQIKELAGALWTICVEEVAKLAGAYRMISTPPEGREENWKPEINERHKEALGLVDQFWNALYELENFKRAAREKRRLAKIVTSFLANLHTLLVAAGPKQKIIWMESRARFAAAAEKAKPTVKIHKGKAVPGGAS